MVKNKNTMNIPMKEKYVDEIFQPLFEFGKREMELVDLASANNPTVITLPKEEAMKVLEANKRYMDELYDILCTLNKAKMETLPAKVYQFETLIVPITWLDGVFHGFGNGYVCIPEGHPLFGMDYDTIHDKFQIDVHGGLTFSDYSYNCSQMPFVPQGNWWIIGFDTAHAGDSLANWPKEAVEVETKRLLDQIKLIP